MSTSAVSRWTRNGRLYRVFPRVYAVGHLGIPVEGRCAAALLYAGPGAALAHQAGGWWWQLLNDPPSTVDVVTPHRRRPQLGLCLHHRAALERVIHRGLPVTTIPQTLLDLASSLPRQRLRRLLAEADYRRLLSPEAIRAELGNGRPGSRKLRSALDDHLPLLARAASAGEALLIELCERHGIPLPEINVWICGFKVDALWRERQLVVEIDSGSAHGTPARMETDRARDLALRAAGYAVVRYTWRQLTEQPERVADDLLSQLGVLFVRPRS